MQTRRKVLAKNASREEAYHKSCRQQKKMSRIAEKKATELITSSAKKKRNVGLLLRKDRDTQGALDLNTGYALLQGGNEGICMTFKNSFDHEPSGDRSAECVMGTIFSPAFHFPKDVHSDTVDKGDFTVLFRSKDQAGDGDHADENVKIDALMFQPAIESQHNLIQNRKEATSCTCSEKSDLILRSSNDSDKQHSCSNIPRMESSHANTSCDEEYTVLGNISTEVSEIYLSMQHSKLECFDEPSHESIPTVGCEESGEDDDFDDFDPYLFMKNLPELSAVVPSFRPTLLPKQTRSCPSITLVLDLDETLVHSVLEPCDDADFTFPVNFNFKEQTVYVRCRPYLMDFMERVSSLFEIIIFTASQSIYAEQLLNVLDPRRKLFRHRIYRESCVYVEGNYLKDLSVLGRDLAHVIIIDNSPQVFGFQVDNGIPIESWFGDCKDQELLLLLPFLESLVGVVDVRPVIAKMFNLREKVASASCVLV